MTFSSDEAASGRWRGRGAWFGLPDSRGCLGHSLDGGGFPFNTLLVNVVGSLIMGLLIAVLAKIDPPQAIATDVRLTVAVGVLGGFTTFSSFLPAVQAAAFTQERAVFHGTWQGSAMIVRAAPALPSETP